jgi:hypothetical protein
MLASVARNRARSAPFARNPDFSDVRLPMTTADPPIAGLDGRRLALSPPSIGD